MKRRTVGVVAALMMSVSVAASAETQAAPDALAQARAAYERGAWDEALAQYKKAHDAAPADSITRVEASLELSNVLWERGELVKARASVEAALEGAKRLKLEAGVGRILLTMGHIDTAQGRLGEASRALRLCVTEASALKDEVFVALCEMNLSLVQRLQGQPGLSDAALQARIEVLRRANTPVASANALARTAELAERQGDLERARVLLDQAHSMAQRANNVPAQARYALRLGRTLQAMGRHAEARPWIERASAQATSMKHHAMLVQLDAARGEDARQRGDTKAAKQHLSAALARAQRGQSPQLVAQSHLALCEALVEASQVDAQPHCEASATRFKALNMREVSARASARLAGMLHARGQLEPAREHYRQAIATLRDDARTPATQLAQATLYANLCQVEQQGDVTGALHTCNEALSALSALPEASRPAGHVAATRYAAGHSAQAEQRHGEALKHFAAAATDYERASDLVRAADAKLRQGGLLARVEGQEAKAEATLREGLAYAERDAQAAQMAGVKRQLLTQLGQLQLSGQRWAEAATTLQTLANLARSASSHDEVAWALSGLAQARLKGGDSAGAIQALEQGVEAARRGKDPQQLGPMMQENLKKLRGR